MFVCKVKHQEKHISEDATSILGFVLCLCRSMGKTTGITFSFQGRQQTEGAVSLDGGLVSQNAGGSSRSCPFPDPHASKSSLDFWRFHRQNFSAPPLGTLCTRWLEKCHPLLRHLYIVLMYVCMLIVCTYGTMSLRGFRTTIRWMQHCWGIYFLLKKMKFNLNLSHYTNILLSTCVTILRMLTKMTKWVELSISQLFSY